MENKPAKGIRIFIFLLTCMCMTLFLGSGANTTPLLPWETESSVKGALLQQDGQSVTCEAVVQRIAARNNPAYFVIKGDYSKTGLVVLCRPPEDLSVGQAVYVEGTIGTLPSNGERYIYDPSVYGYVKNGEFQRWAPFFEQIQSYNKQAMTLPTDPIPPSDPGLVNDGLGIAGEVTANAVHNTSKFDTVASLRATAPSILTSVELTCKPVSAVGEGYIYVGDDNSSATVKVYTNATVKPTDRVIKLTGTAHSENGSLVIYTDSGPDPYFDPQGSNGSVSVVSPGSVAYAGTLSDANGTTNADSISVMSTNSSASTDGSWVYLTGQVVTHIGRYYSYAISGGGWVNVYNIQGIDRTAGIRVWNAAYGPNYSGAIVDVMAKVDTKDGQRILGEWSNDGTSAVDRTSASHCIEPNVLVEGDGTLNVVPVGMSNRDLGGATVGHNLGITGGQGLYNVGSYVTVWGKVKEVGTYDFTQSGYDTMPYMVIDDGSGTTSDNQDVTVFGTNEVGWGTQASIGNYISITGVSSVWNPSGTNNTYRCVWVPDDAYHYAVDQIAGDQTTRQIITTGTISGTVKLYDMPTGQATVNVFCTSGDMATLPITCNQSDNSGSAAYSFTNVPKEVEINAWPQNQQYIVSAKCDGYKTRTYTNVVPDTPRNLYLTQLRKIYVTTNTSSVDPCSGSAVITAKVVNADNVPISGRTVRFRTNKGSFSSSSIIHDFTASSTTNSNGQTTATLYGVPSEYGQATVEATDDSAPLTGDVLTDDTYKYDWEQLSNQYGQDVYITINRPTASLTLTATPTAIGKCGDDMSEITVTLSACGSGIDGVEVSFSTDKGVFNETGTTTATVTTGNGGVATLHFRTASSSDSGDATIQANAAEYSASGSVVVTIGSDVLTLTATPYSVPPSQTSSVITAKLTTPGGVPIAGKHVTFTKTAGNLGNTTPLSGDTDSNGEVQVTLSDVTPGSYAVVEATTTNRCNDTTVQRCQVDFLQSIADDWPMFMHDMRHQGYSRFNDTTTTENLTFGWSKPLPTASGRDFIYDHPEGGYHTGWKFAHPYIDSSPVHASGCPVIVGAWASGDYTSTTTGYVKAFNSTSGTDVWRYPSNSNQYIGAVASTPAVFTSGSNKLVVVGSMDGKVYCLNATTGAYVWDYQTTASGAESAKVLASPAVYNGRVYIGNESATIYCLNAATGSMIWSTTFTHDASWPDRTGVSSVAIGPTASGEMRAYVGCDNGHIYCMSIADNPSQRVLWDYAGNLGEGIGCIESSPTIYAGNVYIGTSFDTLLFGDEEMCKVLAINAATGQPVWKKNLPAEVRATCAIADGNLFVGVDTGTEFYRVTSADGNLGAYNSFYAGNYFVGSAALAPSATDLLFVGNDNSNFYTLLQSTLVNPQTGLPKATRILNGITCSSPAISYAAQDGYRWVYVVSRGNGGTLYAFRTQR